MQFLLSDASPKIRNGLKLLLAQLELLPGQHIPAADPCILSQLASGSTSPEVLQSTAEILSRGIGSEATASQRYFSAATLALSVAQETELLLNGLSHRASARLRLIALEETLALAARSTETIWQGTGTALLDGSGHRRLVRQAIGPLLRLDRGQSSNALAA